MMTVLPAASQSPAGTPGGAAVMEKAPERVRKPSPRYKVLLHNDPVNTMEYVVGTLRQVVPSLSEQDAIAVMLEAHNTGVGLVIVRVPGVAFGMLTLAIGQMFFLTASRARGLTGGADGLQGVVMGPLLGKFDFDLGARVASFYSMTLLFIACVALSVLFAKSRPAETPTDLVSMLTHSLCSNPASAVSTSRSTCAARRVSPHADASSAPNT